MRRYRILKFYIDATRNPFKDLSGDVFEKFKEDHRNYLGQKYGSLNFEEKFRRWLSIPKPVLSVVDEHTHLLEDIEDAYVLGSLYSALTGACCLGERIINQIIIRIRESYRASEQYKKICNKDSINDWSLGIETLKEWKIIDTDTEAKYRRLGKLRTDAVHFQNKVQNLERMAQEAIELINQIVSDLFGLDEKKKDMLIWFEVPGEIFLRKEIEQDPFIKAFYIPAARSAGYKHTIGTTANGEWFIEDNNAYPETDIPDDEFVRLRIEYQAEMAARGYRYSLKRFDGPPGADAI